MPHKPKSSSAKKCAVKLSAGSVPVAFLNTKKKTMAAAKMKKTRTLAQVNRNMVKHYDLLMAAAEANCLKLTGQKVLK